MRFESHRTHLQSELESERQRRQTAEWAVEQARVDLERSTQLHGAELQAVSAAADRRIDALQAEITRLDRSLASAGKLGDELRAQLASAEARSRATASAAKVVEEQVGPRSLQRARRGDLNVCLRCAARGKRRATGPCRSNG